MGAAEDPSEIITKTYTLEACNNLEIRGQVNFTLVPGPQFTVVAKGNRAVMDQLTVYSVFGQALVSVDSGLKGPREKGEVHFDITVPSLLSLRIQDRSSGKVQWPNTSASPRISISEESSVQLDFNGANPKVDIDWKSHLSLRGKAEVLNLKSRHQSQVDLRQFFVSDLYVELLENSVVKAGLTGSWYGSLRQGSRMVKPKEIPRGDLELKEDSVVEDYLGD